MKKLTLLLLYISSLLSCNKNENEKEIEAPEYPVVAKVKTITGTGGAIVQSYTYDATGRQISWQLNNSSKTEHIYSGSSVILIYSNPSTGSINGKDTLTLNAKGLVEKATNYLNPGLLVMYEYNADRYVVKATSNLNGTTTGELRYFYTNNVLDSVVTFINGGSRYSVSHYSNYNSSLSNSFSAYSFGEYYRGREAAYPCQQLMINYLVPVPSVQSQNYAYLADGNGRIIKTTTVNTDIAGGTQTSVTDYTYY